MTNPAAKLCLLAACGLLLGACTTSEVHLSSDYGRSVRESVQAQIADPDARYSRTLEPASDGKRSALAQTRYERNAVIPPVASSVSGAMSAQNGNGSGAGAGASQ
jgi:hypothetical protein